MENSDTIHHLDAHSSIDCNEHYELHGPRPHLHVKEMPPLFDSGGITFLVKYMVERVIILFRILIPLAIPRQRWNHADDTHHLVLLELSPYHFIDNPNVRLYDFHNLCRYIFFNIVRYWNTIITISVHGYGSIYGL